MGLVNSTKDFEGTRLLPKEVIKRGKIIEEDVRAADQRTINEQWKNSAAKHPWKLNFMEGVKRRLDGAEPSVM